MESAWKLSAKKITNIVACEKVCDTVTMKLPISH